MPSSQAPCSGPATGCKIIPQPAAARAAAVQGILELARTYLDNYELSNQNDGTFIDTLQSRFGLRHQQYCAMFVSAVVFDYALQHSLPNRFPFTASSQQMYEQAKDLKAVSADISQLEPGDVLVWRRWQLYKGHVAFVVNVMPFARQALCLEGNVFNSDFGDGKKQGFCLRYRDISKLAFTVDSFYLRGFIKTPVLLGF